MKSEIMPGTKIHGRELEVPVDLPGFRDLHQGETIVVCGCGASLSAFEHPERFVTVGVNDVGRLFDPTYLVVLNPAHQFRGERFKYVRESRARAVFTQLDLKRPPGGIEGGEPRLSHPHVVRFRLGRRGGTDFSDPATLPYTNNSPYVAFCLALYMGAGRIGLVGVDFRDHHFFAETGRHPLAGSLCRIDGEYRNLAEACRKRGVEAFNLSRESRLTAFPKMSLRDFAARSPVRAGVSSAVGDVDLEGLRTRARAPGVRTAPSPRLPSAHRPAAE